MEYKFREQTIILYPEYTLNNREDYLKNNDDIIIGGLQEHNQTKIIATNNNYVVFERAKYRLCYMEKDKLKGTKPRPFTINNINILPISCSEILFPEDYYHYENIDLVTHHVGFEMYDEHQFKAWRALQKSISVHFKCPVVCCSGGEQNSLNLQGIIVVDER